MDVLDKEGSLMQENQPFVEANQKAGSDVLQGSLFAREMYVSFSVTQLNTSYISQL